MFQGGQIGHGLRAERGGFVIIFSDLATDEAAFPRPRSFMGSYQISSLDLTLMHEQQMQMHPYAKCQHLVPALQHDPSTDPSAAETGFTCC